MNNKDTTLEIVDSLSKVVMYLLLNMPKEVKESNTLIEAAEQLRELAKKLENSEYGE